MSPGNGLDIILGIPIRVENDHHLSSSQIDPDSTRLGAQQKHSESSGRIIEVVDRLLSVFSLSRPIDLLIADSFMDQILLNDSKHFCELRKDQNLLLHSFVLLDQLVQTDHFTRGTFELVEVVLGRNDLSQKVLSNVLDQVGMVAALPELHLEIVHDGDVLQSESLLESSFVFLVNCLVDHFLKVCHFDVQNVLL